MMTTQIVDIINGCFEWGGSIFIFLSVRRIYLDKGAKGISPWQFVFFCTWGYWNPFYYGTLNQWWSVAGGIAVVSMNTTWLILYAYYRYFYKCPRCGGTGEIGFSGFTTVRGIEVEQDADAPCPDCS